MVTWCVKACVLMIGVHLRKGTQWGSWANPLLGSETESSLSVVCIIGPQCYAYSIRCGLLLQMQWLNYSARGGGFLYARGLKGRSSSPRAEVGFPTADQKFSSIQGTLFGFHGI